MAVSLLDMEEDWRDIEELLKGHVVRGREELIIPYVERETTKRVDIEKQKKVLIVGKPGSGKTRALLRVLERLKEAGVKGKALIARQLMEYDLGALGPSILNLA